MWTPWRRESGSVANLAVNFPNQSRSYDATRQAVQFWGYDRSMESSFFLTVAALTQIQPNLQPDVAGFFARLRCQPRAHLCDRCEGLCPWPKRLLRTQCRGGLTAQLSAYTSPPSVLRGSRSPL